MPLGPVSAFRAAHAHLEKGAKVPGTRLAVTGRVMNRREAGKKLVFADLLAHPCQQPLQVVCNANHFNTQFELAKLMGKGDIVHFEGVPGRTPAGDLSLYASSCSILAPCLHDLPDALHDTDSRHRNRALDLIVNQHVRERFIMRANLIRHIRAFFHLRGFVEVETPILWNQSGGANAKPFQARSDALGIDLKLRIAPELFLKQLVIGGITKVFELGRVFRNEGVDASHNVEFTMCEAYQAYADYQDMMEMTEDLLRFLAKEFSSDCVVHGIDFHSPFRKIDIIDTLTDELRKRNFPIDSNFDPNNEDNLPFLLDIAARLEIKIDEPKTLPRILDKLIGELVEPLCVQPTFLINHPVCMSPLAKKSTSNPSRTERFELFIQGKEICNAYSELNDPNEQRMRFSDQARLREKSGDAEIPPTDESFCASLEYGLPPTGGWGLGVDRLCMLFANVSQIREIVLFPISK
jgi:lysyl-tRNA synthetase class 2